MYKQAPKSPAMKALVGNQKNLPAGLKAQIEASPGKMMDSPAKNMNKGYGSPAKKGKPTKKANFDGYESIGESDTEKGAHLIRGKSVKSNTAATDHRMSKTAEGKYKVYKSVSPAKMKSPAKQATPKGERDLGEGGLKGLTFKQASSVADEVQKLQNSGVDERDVSTGLRRADSHINSKNAFMDQDRARAGNTYYNKPGNREYTDNIRMTDRVRTKQALARNKAKYSK